MFAEWFPMMGCKFTCWAHYLLSKLISPEPIHSLQRNDPWYRWFTYANDIMFSCTYTGRLFKGIKQDVLDKMNAGYQQRYAINAGLVSTYVYLFIYHNIHRQCIGNRNGPLACWHSQSRGRPHKCKNSSAGVSVVWTWHHWITQE